MQITSQGLFLNTHRERTSKMKIHKIKCSQSLRCCIWGHLSVTERTLVPRQKLLYPWENAKRTENVWDSYTCAPHPHLLCGTTHRPRTLKVIVHCSERLQQCSVQYSDPWHSSKCIGSAKPESLVMQESKMGSVKGPGGRAERVISSYERLAEASENKQDAACYRKERWLCSGWMAGGGGPTQRGGDSMQHQIQYYTHTPPRGLREWWAQSQKRVDVFQTSSSSQCSS